MSAETIRPNTTEDLSLKTETDHGFELDDEAVNSRFEEIVQAEEALIASDPVERDRRNQVTSYKPSQGYDINQLRAAG